MSTLSQRTKLLAGYSRKILPSVALFFCASAMWLPWIEIQSKGAMSFPYAGVFMTKQLIGPYASWFCDNRLVAGGKDAYRCEGVFFFTPETTHPNPLQKWSSHLSSVGFGCLFLCAMATAVLAYRASNEYARVENAPPTPRIVHGVNPPFFAKRRQLAFPWSAVIDITTSSALAIISAILVGWVPCSWNALWNENPVIHFPDENYSQKMFEYTLREGYWCIVLLNVASTLLLFFQVVALMYARVTHKHQSSASSVTLKGDDGSELQWADTRSVPMLHDVELAHIHGEESL